MADSPARTRLAEWLERIEQLHPADIELGLERVAEVARKAGTGRPAPLLITVAGTNGKGSCVAALDHLLRAGGYRSGSYTSPHLLRFNERVRIDGQQATDEALCSAFEHVEAARGEVELTYFEFSTLAALYLLQQAELDAVVLETGLGGRLDAVNILDADLAVISSIDLDHQQWLGESREAIAREKAGILRAGRPVICGDPDPPTSLVDSAVHLDCPLYIQGRDFGAEREDNCWHWWGLARDGRPWRIEELPLPGIPLLNLATVLQTAALRTPRVLEHRCLTAALPGIVLAGRQQWVRDPCHNNPVLLDVAHNPQAAQALAHLLDEWREYRPGRVHLVLAMLADKDCEGLYRALENRVDFWYIAQVRQGRAMTAEQLQQRLQGQGAAPHGPFTTVDEAYADACARASGGDTIVIAGSFYTVSEIMQFLDDANARDPRR